jgi:hypothetical protein
MASNVNLSASCFELTSNIKAVKLRMVVIVYRVPKRARILHVVRSCLELGL